VTAVNSQLFNTFFINSDSHSPSLEYCLVFSNHDLLSCILQAAARHQCSYLVKLHTTEFLLQGGDPQWLKGLDNIPQKLKDLNEVNKLLAHRPWLINKTHIEVRETYFVQHRCLSWHHLKLRFETSTSVNMGEQCIVAE
jgi:hypothetical protein